MSMAALYVVGCADGSGKEQREKVNDLQSLETNKEHYIQALEKINGIRYAKIINTRGGYITSMCYTKTKDAEDSMVSNPCYSCHTKGKVPNYFNDTNLQKEYSFPKEVLKNPFTNLFKDRSQKVGEIMDETILNYIRNLTFAPKPKHFLSDILQHSDNTH